MPISRKIMGVSKGRVFTGALSGTSTIAAGTAPRGVCISADGKSVYAVSSGNVQIFDRNTTTGALSGTSTIAAGSGVWDTCISADGASVYVYVKY